MANVKLAVSLSCLRQPLKQALHTAARLGATGIEIDARNGLRPEELSDTGRRQLRKMMDDLNLRVAAVRFPTHRGYEVVDDLDRRIDATKSAMHFAYKLGCRTVINAVGYIPDEENHPITQQLATSLTDLAKHGQHCGAMLACETGSEPVHRLVQLLDSLPEQAIGLHFNPARLIVNNHYTEDCVRVAASRVLSVALVDGVRDLSRGRGIEVEVGRGSAEFPEILGVLEEQGFDGWLIAERHAGNNTLRDIENAFKFVRAL